MYLLAEFDGPIETFTHKLVCGSARFGSECEHQRRIHYYITSSNDDGVHNPHQARVHVRLPTAAVESKKQQLAPIKSNLISIYYHSGGLELLFSSQRSHKIALPSTDPSTNLPANVGFLIDWLCKNLMKDPRQDMFVLEGTV
jgi:hypothetical protein